MIWLFYYEEKPFMKNFWDDRYATAEFVYGTSPNHFFSEAISNLAPGRMLLPGEGEGRNAVFAASLGWHVDAYDQSDNGAIKARQLARMKDVNISYTVGSLEHLSFKSGYYDVAALIFVHLPPSFRSLIHTRITEALRPGGCFIMEAFHTSQLERDTGGPRSVEMLYDAELLRRDFSGLELSELNELEVELDEGRFHRGTAAVVRMIGKKPNINNNGTGTEE
jgi:SAM-dependent methyltransferase